MSDTSTIEGLHAAWIAAFNAHDLDAHQALYTEDAMLFGSIPDLVVGRAGIRAYFGARDPSMRVRRYPLPRILHLSPDFAATAAHVDFAEGETLFPYRVTWMLVRQHGAWRIAQHHGSPRQDA